MVLHIKYTCKLFLFCVQINNLKSIQGCENCRIKTQLSSSYVEGLQFDETDVSNFECSLKSQTQVACGCDQACQAKSNHKLSLNEGASEADGV